MERAVGPSCGSFEEEEEGTSVASDVVKVQGEDQDTPGYLRSRRVSCNPSFINDGRSFAECYVGLF